MAAQVEHIKWILGTNFMVDGFKFQHPRCKHYFLTHQHSDHTIGLQRSFSAGTIYCSPITKTLLVQKMRIPTERIQPLEMDVRHEINGVGVTLIDANHCPGAAMFLFEVPAASGKQQACTRILHCGDMRWQDSMAAHPALAGSPLDVLYLDTTYASPRHTHPPQAECIARMVDIVREEHAKEPATLFVIGAYSIGKERAFLGTAKALGWKIWCEADKVKTMRLLRLPEESLALLTANKAEARIHVTFMGAALQPEKLAERMKAAGARKVVGFRPTGWTFKKSGKLEVRRQGPVTIYGVPYSEHSAFNELRDCVRLLRPKRIIPTVNITDDPATVRAIVDRFADLMDLSGDRTRLDAYFAAAKRETADACGRTAAAAAQHAATPCTEAVPTTCKPERSQRVDFTPQADVAESCSPRSRADACGSAAGFNGTAEPEALSEGSPPPPDGPHDCWQPDGLEAVDTTASAGAEAGSSQPADAAAADEPPRSAGLRQCQAFGIAPGGATERHFNAADGATLHSPSAPAAIDASAAAQRVDASAATAGKPFALDAVDLEEQEAIWAAIHARKSRNGGVGGSEAGSVGSGRASKADTGSASQAGSGGGERKRAFGGRASAPAAMGKAAGKTRTPSKSPGENSDTSREDKKQRTLTGFFMSRAQACKS